MSHSPLPLLDGQLPPMPRRIGSLPLCEDGQPQPWFAAENQGFGTVPRPGAAVQAGREQRCWACGQPLGRYVVFLLSAQQALTRIAVEPGCHLECAGWIAAAAPFLQSSGAEPAKWRSHLRDLAGEHEVIVLWSSRTARMLPHLNGFLFDVGDAEACSWYRGGRLATLAEVAAALALATRELKPQAEAEGPQAMAQLLDSIQALLRHMPAAAEHPIPSD